MKPLAHCRLYGILDTGWCSLGRLPAVLTSMIRGGIDIVQLRAKDLSPDRIAELTAELHPISRAAGIPFILNDHPALAGQAGVEGAHVGVEDMTVAEARRLAGPRCWIGKSSHSPAQAADGEAQGADYLGFGPLFATPTKPSYVPVGLQHIRAVEAAAGVPVFCIGGIKLENLPQVLASGARRAVIVSGILQAADPADYVRRCSELLHTASLSPGAETETETEAISG